MSGQVKKAIWIYADLEVSPIGTRSRLSDELAGKPVLKRTIDQLCKTTEFDVITVFCQNASKDEVITLINTTDEKVEVVGINSPVKSKYIKYRKWSIECWRGGVGEYTQFDEDAVSPEMVNYGIDSKHNVVMICPAASVLIDPELLDGMARHYDEHRDEMRFIFSQSPPGLCGCMYRLDLLHNIVQSGLSIGNVIAYDPESPHSDHIAHECTYKVGENIYSCFSRFIADNWRSTVLLNEILDTYENVPGAVELVSFANKKTQSGVYEFPREIEVEITSNPSLRYSGYPHTVKDRSSWKCSRSDMQFDIFKSIVDQCRDYDDLCLTIGGFGEPLLHSQLVEFSSYAKQSGIFGVNIETDGMNLTPELCGQLIAAGVDIITIHIDAWEEATWSNAKNQHGGFGQVISHAKSAVEMAKGSDTIIVCSMVKTRETLADMEPFYNEWRKLKGVSIIKGFNDYCGFIEDENVMNMCPPARFPCNSLLRQLMILADGTISACPQDFEGINVCGNVSEDSLKSVWVGGKCAAMRQNHFGGIFTDELCKNCKEWFR